SPEEHIKDLLLHLSHDPDAIVFNGDAHTLLCTIDPQLDAIPGFLLVGKADSIRNQVVDDNTDTIRVGIKGWITIDVYGFLHLIKTLLIAFHIQGDLSELFKIDTFNGDLIACIPRVFQYLL